MSFVVKFVYWVRKLFETPHNPNQRGAQFAAAVAEPPYPKSVQSRAHVPLLDREKGNCPCVVWNRTRSLD